LPGPVCRGEALFENGSDCGSVFVLALGNVVEGAAHNQYYIFKKSFVALGCKEFQEP
jgi:hypothetical protein